MGALQRKLVGIEVALWQKSSRCVHPRWDPGPNSTMIIFIEFIINSKLGISREEWPLYK
jgi:hypothetical protein